jgi:predicted  nucleic acid-binding Zn-ribbon protein
VSSDPLDRALKAIAAAQRERDDLRTGAERTRLEVHQLRRRLDVAEEQGRALRDRVADLVGQVEAANERADAHKRAMLEHAGRSRTK